MGEENLVDLPFFLENGFVKKKCRVCGSTFWTLNTEQEVCGDQPCVDYQFVDNPLNPSFGTLSDVREAFLSFFEKHGHERVPRYPVVARWRTDVYLVGASIYDFQPWVTEGIVDPPANPLTISQPSIRLTDVDNVGRSGRHMTGFEMMAHHAFNVKGAKVYWANDTVRYAFEVLTKAYGIPPEEISFKFDWWSGGGNAGEDYEVLVRGLEVATLVFMHYKVVDDKPIPMENKIVDTGYGLERIYWLLKGGVSIYEAVFPGVIEWLRREAGVEVIPEDLGVALAKKVGKLDYKEPEKTLKVKAEIARSIGLSLEEMDKILSPHEAIWAVSDHTRSLMWMIGDGVVPSNVGAGYLARLLIRRAIRHLKRIGYPVPLVEVVARQVELWKDDFPEHYENVDDILDIIDWEEKKYRETIRRGRKIVAKTLRRYGKRGEVPVEELVKLYESHGVPPDVVAEEAEKLGVEVEIPPDFYYQLAKNREQAPQVTGKRDIALELLEKVERFPDTRKLYYEDPYISKFKAKVLGVIDGKYVVLDKTAFYPEGGGQPADTGYLEADGERYEVRWVGKVGGVVVHLVEGANFKPGDKVVGVVDFERRKNLMRHHTATHIILGAARRVLGHHVWQAGAQKGVEQSRLDITHHKKITDEEIREIERLANEVVLDNREVGCYFMDRNAAEKKYGFILYQGGVVPEPILRVVEIKGWDVEACGGTHVKSTGEVGLIKIVKVERIQDGVSRLVYKAGLPALKYVQEQDAIIKGISARLKVERHDLERKVSQLLEEYRNMEKRLRALEREELLRKAEAISRKAEEVSGFKLVVHEEEMDREKLRDLAIEVSKLLPKSVIVVLSPRGDKTDFALKLGDEAVKAGLDAKTLTSKLLSAVKGSGGGSKDLAQGVISGVKVLDKVKNALTNILREC